MFFGLRASNRRFVLAPPDIAESRGDLHLLVWGDLPHWMVMDDEMRRFLQRFDGELKLKDVVAGAPNASHGVMRTVADLVRRGVLRDVDARVGADADAPQPKLKNIAVNLTSRCNLRCAFCYARDAHAGAGEDELTAEEVNAFLRAVKPLAGKPCSLVLLGGEPFLAPEKLFAVAAQAKRLGFASIVSTNGVLITPELAQQARRVGLQVQVSIDGADRETHDRVRGRGAFDKAVAAVRELVRARAYTVVSMVCHQDNVEQLERFYDLSRSLGVNEARFIPLKLIGAAQDCGLRPIPTSELMAAAYALFRRRPEHLALLGRDALSILANTCRYSAKRQSCGTGLQTILLDADGALYPCLNMARPEYRLSSIRDENHDFARLWREAPALQKLRDDTSVSNTKRACSRCPVRYWCLGGCRGETVALTGDIRRPSPYCADLRRTMLDMMWMLAESPDMIRPSVKIC